MPTRKIATAIALVALGYTAAAWRPTSALADQPSPQIPKFYGRLAAAVPDQIGTDLVFEDKVGTIRFVNVSGLKEGQLERYDTKPIHGGIPRAFGHLVTAVVNTDGTALIFEDKEGVIRIVTITGEMKNSLQRTDAK